MRRRDELLGCSFEQVVDLLVGRLREIAVPHADGIEWLWRAGADGLVRFRLKLRARVRGADRHGNDDARRPSLAEGSYRRAPGGAGGQAIVDEDNEAA